MTPVSLQDRENLDGNNTVFAKRTFSANMGKNDFCSSSCQPSPDGSHHSIGFDDFDSSVCLLRSVILYVDLTSPSWKGKAGRVLSLISHFDQ